MALATQTHLEQHLQVSFTNNPDNAVTMLLEAATGLIETYCQRRFTLNSYSESFTVTDKNTPILVSQWPIDTGTNPVVVTDTGSTLTAADIKIDPRFGAIYRIGPSGVSRPWRARGPLSVTVTYDAGYDMTADPLTEPEAATVRDVCVRIAGRSFRAGTEYADTESGNIVAVSLDGSDSVTYQTRSADNPWPSPPQLTPIDEKILGPLRRHGLVMYG